MAKADRDDLISIIEDDEKGAEIPLVLPLMPVRDIVVFTDMVLPLFVGREKSVRAVQEAVAKEGYLFLATQMDPAIDNPARWVCPEKMRIRLRNRAINSAAPTPLSQTSATTSPT